MKVFKVIGVAFLAMAIAPNSMADSAPAETLPIGTKFVFHNDFILPAGRTYEDIGTVITTKGYAACTLFSNPAAAFDRVIESGEVLTVAAVTKRGIRAWPRVSILFVNKPFKIVCDKQPEGCGDEALNAITNFSVDEVRMILSKVLSIQNGRPRKF